MLKRRYNAGTGRKRARVLLLLALALIVGAAVGGTWAYQQISSDPVTNTFAPGTVDNEITEDFDGTVKKNVNVKNTGDVHAYIRVKLVTYRVNDKNEHIGGTATITMPETLGEGWVEHEGYYYYTKPVAPGESPAKPLIGSDGITLQTYTDADGGHQVIEVLGEAIQAAPPEAAGKAWGVTITPPEGTTPGSVTAYPAGGGGE